MGKSPSVILPTPKGRRAYGKKGKNSKSKTTAIKDPTFEELQGIKEANISEFGQPKKTKDEYNRIRKCSRKWLSNLIEKRKEEEKQKEGPQKKAPDDINIKLLAKAFDRIPNKYSAYALELYLTHKCLNEGNGRSTATGIHAAWADEWDNADGTTYAGEYNLDTRTGALTGCPARAPAIKKLVKTIKARDGKKGTAATRHHAEAMRVEDLETILAWSESVHPTRKTQSSHGTSNHGETLDHGGTLNNDETLNDDEILNHGEALKHGMTRAFLTTGFVLWTRNFETCQLQRRDLTLNCVGNGPHREPYIRVHLENRKGWQNKQGWDGPLGSNTYHIYKQDIKAIDMYTHLLKWIGMLQSELGRPLEDDDYLFPTISVNGVPNPKKSITHEYVQNLLNEFGDGANIDTYYSTHCLRRGGAQYRMMYAPLSERWSIARIRWWGGWAESESVDTLMKYLLDSLQSYESGHADALARRPTQATDSASSLSPKPEVTSQVTKSDLQQLQEMLVSTIEGINKQPPLAPCALSNVNDLSPTLLPTIPTPSPPPGHLVYYLAPMQTASIASAHIGPALVPVMLINGMTPQPLFMGSPTAFQSAIPISQQQPTGNLSSEMSHQPQAIETNKTTDLTPIPVINRNPNLPKAGLCIPNLDRNDPKAWLEAVCQWEVGIPEQNIPPLRDWDPSDYQGANRHIFGTKRTHRKVVADEYNRIGRSEKMFEELYGHLKGTAAKVIAIQNRNGVKRRRSKNGLPEERDDSL